MRRFRKILVHIRADGPKPLVLSRAERLAQECNAALHFVDVMDEAPAYLRSLMPWDLPDAIRQFKQEYLERFAQPLRGKGLKVSWGVLQGATPTALIQDILRHGHDLLLKTAEQEDSDLVGTVDMRLLRQCPCPVWLERPARARRKRRVLAAINVMANDQEEAELNRNILDLAASISQFEQAELHVVHAWRAYGESMVRNGFVRLSQDEVDRYVEQARSAADQQLQTLINNCTVQGVRATCHLVKGDAGEVIPAIAKEQRADLVVMGTVARTGVSNVLIGNTAERIIRRLNCSLLALKPAGFTSPITLPDRET
jgi:universal stress protein E